MSLDQLWSDALTCQACRLAERRRNVVFGEGNASSPLVLVGEGPGEQEDRTGRPFVGRAGQLLDRALRDNGLAREHVYICNVVKCRACDWVDGKARNRPPMEDEAAACRRWLVPQLRAIAPKVILCIGSPSAKNLIKKDFRITQERGKYFPCEFARTALATLHPAYILRQQSDSSDGGYGLLVADIGRAWEAAQRLAAGSAAKDAPGAGPLGSVIGHGAAAESLQAASGSKTSEPVVERGASESPLDELSANPTRRTAGRASHAERTGDDPTGGEPGAADEKPIDAKPGRKQDSDDPQPRLF